MTLWVAHWEQNSLKALKIKTVDLMALKKVLRTVSVTLKVFHWAASSLKALTTRRVDCLALTKDGEMANLTAEKRVHSMDVTTCWELVMAHQTAVTRVHWMDGKTGMANLTAEERVHLMAVLILTAKDSVQKTVLSSARLKAWKMAHQKAEMRVQEMDHPKA